ncbi:MAG: hypothetical protein Q9203_001977 [Teloschistes exilis]
MAPHVCIVGAGASGLRCATVLLEHSYKVTIIEARNRIGGRVAQSDEMGGLEVDIDSSSTGYNPIVELAKETGTPLHQWNESALLIDGQGRSVDRSEADRALKRVWQILEEAMEYSTKRSDELLPSVSLYNYFTDWCHRSFRAGDMSQREVDLVEGMAEMWGAYVGDRCELQSLKFFYLEDCINGGK